MDNSYKFLSACLGTNGNLAHNGKANGGGPIWAIFDADAVAREKWDPNPPNIDPNGWFFSADTIAALAARTKNPYQLQPISGMVLEQTVTRYNGFVDAAKDYDFGKPTPMYKIQKPPFYAAWSTPILHDSLTALKINRKCQVHRPVRSSHTRPLCVRRDSGRIRLARLPRVIVFGRVAGREAAGAAGS
jgi:hypothetical protein